MFVEKSSRAMQNASQAVVYSPDGRVLATAGEDKTIALRDAATGAVLKTLIGHTDMITGLAFSPDCQDACLGEL